MSFDEYIDMFKDCQNEKCPYRAFTFDVVNSRNQTEYIDNPEKHFQFVSHVYSLLEKEEENTGKQILLRGKFNRKLVMGEAMKNGNLYNPMILGDMATYFVYNGSITTDRMLELFATGLKECDINYPFHFKTGVYQTNNYIEGGKKLYKGYMPQILERESKSTNITISKDCYNIEDCME